MNGLRSAASIAITVLLTVLIATATYGAVRAQQHPLAAVQSGGPTPSPSYSLKPIPSSAPSPVAPAVAGFYTYDVDMIDASTGWMLVSNCPLHNAPTCRHAVVATADGGQTWSKPVQVGPPFASGDGGAPRTIRFLNRLDGFVYGGSGAFVSHDAGGTWLPTSLPAVFISSISMSAGVVWAVTYPCLKGTLCEYEVRSSRDAGRTWSPVHKLPLNFAPVDAVAFPSGLVLASVPPGKIEMTSNNGGTWRDMSSPCNESHFGSFVSTSDGTDLWQVCMDYPAPSGVLGTGSLFVSSNGGASWVERSIQRRLFRWLATPFPGVAYAWSESTMIVTHDGGATWTAVQPVQLESLHFRDLGWGWGLDPSRTLWVTADGGARWISVGPVPDRLD